MTANEEWDGEDGPNDSMMSDSGSDGARWHPMAEATLSSARVRCLRLCSIRDIVAIAERDDIVAYRYTEKQYQKLWSVPINPNSEAVAIAWRPDGKLVAVGCSNGSVKLIELETGELVDTQQIFNNEEDGASTKFEFTMFEWISVPVKKSADSGREEGITLPELSPLQKTGITTSVAGNGTAEAHQRVWADQDNLNLLIAANSMGQVVISLSSILQIGDFNIRDIMKSRIPEEELQTACVVASSLSMDLSALRLLVSITSYSGKQAYRIVTLDTMILRKSANRVREFVDLASAAHGLMIVAEEAVRCIALEWEALEDIKKKTMDVLCDKLEEAGEDSDPTQEFAYLLATGVARDVLSEFLSRDTVMGEKGLKKWITVTETTSGVVRQYIHVNLQPGLQRVILHLHKMAGLCWWEPHRDDKGLTHMEQCMAKCGRLILGSDEMSWQLGNLQKIFRAFATWIQTVSKALRESEHDIVQSPPSKDYGGVVEFIHTLTSPTSKWSIQSEGQSTVSGHFNELCREAKVWYPESASLLSAHVGSEFGPPHAMHDQTIQNRSWVSVGMRKPITDPDREFFAKKPWIGLMATRQIVEESGEVPFSVFHLAGSTNRKKAAQAEHQQIVVNATLELPPDLSVQSATWVLEDAQMFNERMIIATWSCEGLVSLSAHSIDVGNSFEKKTSKIYHEEFGASASDGFALHVNPLRDVVVLRIGDKIWTREVAELC
ncbi:anaphase-promoting complex, cyclosome, subunit 4-domain-containing protein [Cladochytrium replicatum]|nr:anaphase-promoting complex, cyclosome, subunit 4-domain-containing protein [Cladochytrium replicatum]